VTPIFMIAFKVAIVIFMAGNLLDMGLRLDARDALRGLRNMRFVGLTLLWGFGVGPAVAFAIAFLLPLDPAYGMGLLLIGMAPCAPFLPMIAERGKGDLGYTAAFMLLCAGGTVAFMPLAVPLMAEGLSVSALAIAAPLVMVVLLPLGIGMAVHKLTPGMAARLQPLVRRVTALATGIVVLLCGVLYGSGLLGVGGTFAIAAQLLFFAAATVLPYRFGLGLPHDQRIVLSTGMATRNLGAAFAPLLAAPDADQRALIMVVLALPIMTAAALLSARLHGRRGAR
jgi:BASS family bile acid:Na+ symporter